MDYTDADLASLKKAIASGSLEVQMGDRSRKYRSMAELREAYRFVRDQLDGDSAGRRVYAVRTGTRKGLA